MKRFRTVFSALLMLTIVFSMFANSAQALSIYDKALFSASLTGDINEVERLIETGADVNVKNVDGMTALMYAVTSGHTEIAQRLIKKGADINAKNNSGNTPLRLASSGGKTDTVRLLIEKGVDINANYISGDTALASAAKGRHRDIVRLLIEKGADIETALNYAKKYRKLEFIVSMIEDEQQKWNDAKKTEGRRANLKTSFERDKRLPLSVRKDKYMLALKKSLTEENFEEALVYFDFLERLNIKLPPSFTFFYGEALLKMGKPEAAIDKLYKYIELDGAQGKYYSRALELTTEAEEIL